MGQARNGGSFEERKQAAIESGRVKSKFNSSVRQRFHDQFLGATAHGDDVMALAMATVMLGRSVRRKNK